MRVLLLVLLLLWCCGRQEEFATVKVAATSNPAVVIVNKLFSMLIGRIPTPAERQSLIVGYSDTNRTNFYRKLLDNILQSKLYHTEGFLYLHRERLLIEQRGTKTFLNNSLSDSEALQLELTDLSYANDYRRIFDYRDRWLNLSHLQLNSCRYWLQQLMQSQAEDGIDAEQEESSAQRRCRLLLQASFDPLIKHYLYANKKQLRFSSIYKPRCCPVQYGQENLCQRVDAGYQQLYGMNFCAVANRSATADNSPAIETIWDKDKMLTALLLAISLRLSAGHDAFIAVSAPEIQFKKTSRFNYYIKVRVPPLLQGIHASPFWLSQHASSRKNKDLHRARLIYHSWFCETILPENANKSDPDPLIPAKFTPYFAEDDIHTREFGSCFNCHKMVQPLANYFGQLSDGIDYQQQDVNDKTSIAARFFNLDTPFDRPGGFYDEKRADFFPFGQQHGMAGLADLLSNLARVRRCLVNSTWNGFFGSKWHLNASEVEQAVQFFVKGGFNYRQLLRYLLTTDKAITFFTEGAQSFYNKIEQERHIQQLTCSQIQNNNYGINAAQVISGTCGSCHAGVGPHAKFIDNDKNFVLQNNAYLRTVFARVTGLQQPLMPPNGMWFSPAEPATFTVQKKALTCFLTEQAKKLGVELPTTPSSTDNKPNLTMQHKIDGEEQ